MKGMRGVANEIKPDFWLMGEVIHGEYNRWVNAEMLHSVTNYHLNKALWSGCNDFNFFEIAHTVKRLYDMGGGHYENMRLYNFADNHDVERIINKLKNRSHFGAVHTLMYTLPGIPSIYYGSEFGIEGRKENGSDAPLRPCLHLDDYADAQETNPYTAWITKLGNIRRTSPALSYGEYKELLLTNRQYAFIRSYGEEDVIVAVNIDDAPATISIPYGGGQASFTASMQNKEYDVCDGKIEITLDSGESEIFLAN